MPSRNRDPNSANLWVRESNIILADNTTRDVSTTKHGFVPKAPSDSTKFLNGSGAWAVPAGGSTSICGYPLAGTANAFAQYNHAAGDFSVGIYFMMMWTVTCTSLRFAYDGFASKTVKWTVWDKGTAHASSTSLDTGTKAVSAVGLYTCTFASPIAFTELHWYTIALYINDGTNFIHGTAVPTGWTNAQSKIFIGPVAYQDIAFYTAGDAEPLAGSGTNPVPVELVP
jgi:hypothetical protein